MFSVKIKEIRESKNLNQETIANAINVSKNTYLNYEKGTQSPKLETIEKLAKYYGISVSEVIGDSEPSMDYKLKNKLSMIDELDEQEKESLMIIIEGLIMRNRNKTLEKKFNE